MGTNKPQPFSSFGEALRRLRETNSRSQIEVSSAVEIEQEKLQSYELGEVRPSRDILMLLIQHFNLKGQAASELWRLAGYEETFVEDVQYFINDDEGEAKKSQSIAINPADLRIVYTDMLQVMVNNYGVIINFMQGAGPNGAPLAVSRIGMSKEHARSVIEVLKTTLEQSENPDSKTSAAPKQLPSGRRKKQD